MGGGSKKQTIGYKYYLDVHAILTHGPVDLLLGLQFDKRTAWSGSLASGTFNVSADNLFGGDKREGGVSGSIDFMSGGPAQTPNSYLDSILIDTPAFRGVSGLVFKQFYFGMNPYLKIWSARLQRIHKDRKSVV